MPPRVNPPRILCSAKTLVSTLLHPFPSPVVSPLPSPCQECLSQSECHLCQFHLLVVEVCRPCLHSPADCPSLLLAGYHQTFSFRRRYLEVLFLHLEAFHKFLGVRQCRRYHLCQWGSSKDSNLRDHPVGHLAVTDDERKLEPSSMYR